MNVLKYISGIFCLITIQTFAQERLEFNYIGGNKGLSENIVNDIVQDHNGYIWIATNDGLNRYDGYLMTHFRYDPANIESLSSNVLECLYIDGDGMLWIGTSEGGLNKYNPITNTFKRFQNDPDDEFSIASGMIEDIIEDTDGHIWVYIRNKGIDRLELKDNQTRFIHYNTHKLGNNYIGILKSNYCTKLEKAQHEGIWVASDKGLQKIYANKNKAENLTHWRDYANRPVSNIVEYSDSMICIVYKKGKIVFGEIRKQNIQNTGGLIVKNERTVEPFDGRTSVSKDKRGVLWLGTGNGLLRLNSTGVTEYKKDQRPLNNLPTNRILSTFVDNNNFLWLGTYNYGALNSDINSNITYNFDDLFLKNSEKDHFFFNNAVHSFCEDNFGALWIGTEGGGIMRIREGFRAFTNNNEKNQAHVDFFSNNGITTPVLPDNNIYSLFCDSENRIWIGSHSGLSCIKIKSPFKNNSPLKSSYLDFDFFKSQNSNNKVFGNGAVYVIQEDKFGTIWIATWDGGLQRFNEKTKKFEQFLHNPSVPGSLSHNTIRSILFEENGDAWIGTAGGGLNKMIFPNGKEGTPYFIHYKNNPEDNKSISNNYILNLVKDKKGDLWIGTFGGGLNKLIIPKSSSDNITFKRYTNEEQLPNNTIKSILFDNNNNLWASTNRELFKMNTTAETVSLIVDTDKIKLDEFKDNSSYIFDNGYMLWGGIGGLVLFSPEEFRNESLSLNTCITNILIDNKQVLPKTNNVDESPLTSTIEYTDKIVLPYDKNTIDIEFSGMLFADQDRINYKYFLEGYDEHWLTTNRRYARYTKIPQGDYIFHVKASSDGVNWIGKERSLQIKIEAPYWLSTFAYIAYIIMFFLVVYIIYRLIVFRIKLKNQIKIEHIKREQAEKAHNSKLQFFTNISHELRTPLSLISNPIEKLLTNKEINTDTRQKMLEIVNRNSIRLQNLINQLLDFRKMESGVSNLHLVHSDIVPLVYDVFKAFEDIAEKKQINYRFNCHETAIKCYFDKDKIEKILFNLISNSLKFTPSNGTIVLTLSRTSNKVKGFQKRQNNYLRIEVADTGIGIHKEKQSKIFERFYQVEDSNRGKIVGTGIGLAYTNNLVKMHQGEIELNSTLGEGTKFAIIIPSDREAFKGYGIDNIVVSKKSEYIKDEIRGLRYAIEDKEKLAHESDNTVHEYTLLIVEDNNELRYYLESELADNYNIITTTNGVEGLQVAKEVIPDLIISDIMMPLMDGIEMCRILKTQIETCHIPIVILTAKAGLDAEKEGLETGADEYILKPFKIDLLKLRIKNLLQTKTSLFEQSRNESDKLIFRQAKESKENELLDNLAKIVKENLDNSNFDIEELSQAAGYSRSALYKKIKQLTDMSTTEFVRYVKLKEATKLLKQNIYTIEQVTYIVGFSDTKYFRKCFKKVYGKTPSEYIKEFHSTINGL